MEGPRAGEVTVGVEVMRVQEEHLMLSMGATNERGDARMVCLVSLIVRLQQQMATQQW